MTALTVGIIEGLSSALGDEFNELAGQRSTRLTAQMAKGDTTANVETTLGWPSAGDVYIEDVRYYFTGKTATTLTGLSQVEPTHSTGRLQIPDGAALNDGETLDIYGQTFEIDKNATITPGNVQWAVTGAMTALEAAQVLVDAINNPALGIDVEAELLDDPDGLAVIGLRYKTAGLAGDVAIASTITSAGFSFVGMLGGSLETAGAVRVHPTMSEVIDFSGGYSAIEQTKQKTQVDHATGSDLDVVGDNLSVPRPSGLADATHRELIKATAYSWHGTVRARELMLDALFGAGNWEMFEDLGIGSVRRGCTVYIRLRNENELSSLGKAFLDGVAVVPSTDATHVTLPETPIYIGGIRLAAEPNGRLVRSGRDRGVEELGRLVSTGVDATCTNAGRTVNAPANSFTDVKLGDIFVIESGPQAGKMATVEVRNSATQLTLVRAATAGAPPAGSPFLSIDANLSSVSWKVVRPYSNFRHYKPEDDKSIGYVGGAAAAVWTYMGADAGDVTLAGTDAGDDGKYLKLADNDVARVVWYKHAARIHTTSRARFELRCAFEGTVAAGAGNGIQGSLHISDGVKKIAVGCKDEGVKDGSLGFIDATTGDFLASAVLYDFDLAEWMTIEIVKDGTKNVQLWVNGRLIESRPYADFAASADRQLGFGCFSTALSGIELWAKQADWSIETDRDFTSEHAGAGDAETIAPDTVKSTSITFANPADVGRRVSIKNFSALNVSGGCARGTWKIVTVLAADQVAVIGETKKRATTQRRSPVASSVLNRRIVVKGDDEAFAWPDNHGCTFVIENGPNAGSYGISKFLDPVSFEDIDNLHNAYRLQRIAPPGGWPASADDLPLSMFTSVIELTTDLPDPSDDTECDWHLEPLFPADATNVEIEVHDRATAVGATLTLPAALPAATELVEGDYTTVESAILEEDERTKVSLVSPGVYDGYSFYLADLFGSLRAALLRRAPAGVFIDLDSLMRDQENYPDPDDGIEGLTIVDD